jgi:hypothetical protein
MMIRISFGFLFLILCNSCAEKPSRTRSSEEFDLEQLSGRWEFQDNRTKIEEWTLLSDDELTGRGFVLSGEDTSFIEFLSIRKDGGVLKYLARVSGEDSGEIVPFTLSFQNETRIEFVNENLDFPKKIGYEVVGPDKIESYIEGPRDGQTVRIVFDYEKKK